MPGVPTAAAAAPRAGREELARRLRKLEKVFPIGDIRAEAVTPAQVVDYYELCHQAYRKYHSAEGAVHMALNNHDRFDAGGFSGQLQRIEQRWATQGHVPAEVLELAFGQGFNLAYLAGRHPACRLAGIDLTPAHADIAARRLQREGHHAVRLALGDFHRLPYADEAFDEAFCIEAFCHAHDPRQAFGELTRVLRRGARFTLFDGYLPRPPSLLEADEALAVELVARGLAVDALQVLDELLALAQAAGLVVESVTVLDAEVMPSLRRLQRLTDAVIRWPWLGRWALSRRPALRGRNVLAGTLMCSSVALGLIGYREIVLRKPR
jgi:SAM-dependent methyltransferase